MAEETTERISINRLALFKRNDNGKSSILNFSINNGAPKVIIFLNTGDETVTGWENMVMLPLTFVLVEVLASAIETVAFSKEEKSISIQSKSKKWVDNKITDDIVINGKITVSKDSKGINYLETSSEGKPTIRFNLVADSNYSILLDGIDITNTAKGSALYAKAYAQQLHSSFKAISARETVRKEIKVVPKLK